MSADYQGNRETPEPTYTDAKQATRLPARTETEKCVNSANVDRVHMTEGVARLASDPPLSLCKRVFRPAEQSSILARRAQVCRAPTKSMRLAVGVCFSRGEVLMPHGVEYVPPCERPTLRGDMRQRQQLPGGSGWTTDSPVRPPTHADAEDERRGDITPEWA